jgi:glycosyltransferase involved in cell wall biosynthesis
MNVKDKNVWFVSHTADLGGAERCMLEMMDVFIDLGARCNVIVPGEGKLIGELKRRDVNSRITHYRWWASPNRNTFRRYARRIINNKARKEIESLLFSSGADLVVTNTITISVGAEAASSLDIPHIWVIQEFGEEDHGLMFDLGLEKSAEIMDTCSNRIIINSRAVFDKYRKHITKEKLNLLYYYFEPPAIERAKAVAKDHEYVMVGAIQPGKGQKTAIDALKILHEKGIKGTLDFYGGGREDYENELRNQISTSGIEEYIKWHGWVPTAWEKMYDGGALLVCSRCEAFGRITVESMLMKTSVIGSASGGTKELIGENEERGYLFKPGNSENLAEAMIRMYSNKEMKAKKSEAAYKWALETFDRDKYRNNLIAILDGI